MTDFSAPEQLVAFLGRYAPFDGLDGDELGRLIEESALRDFPENAVILDGLSSSPEHAWVVLRGRVGLWNFPTVPLAQGAELPGLDDVVGPGGVFGYVVILAGAKGGPRAVALSDVTLLRLPAWSVAPMFSTPAGAAFLASELAREPVVQGVASERRERTAAEIVRRDPVVCGPDVTIRDAAVQMTGARSGYVVVSGPDGPAGIVTDHDLRARVISTGRPVTDPVGEVMTAPLYSVQAQAISSDVLIDMLDRKLHYMPVLDDGGGLLGVVQDVDFLTSPTTSTFALQRQIEHAPASDLPELGRRIRDIFPVLLRQQENPRHISGVASVATEAMVRRCIELELPVHPDLQEGDFTWLSLGSVSRREVMPSSDVDSAIILTDLPEGTRERTWSGRGRRRWRWPRRFTRGWRSAASRPTPTAPWPRRPGSAAPNGSGWRRRRRGSPTRSPTRP
ncbi:CBS domain-containing protein [Tsukamurella soli]|uniref:CBS domain-containing protein n=1 Tax=Tsukamurella soli TaxID=644556 RepID=UPI00362441A8